MERIERRDDFEFELSSGAVIGAGEYTGITCYQIIKSKGYEVEMKLTKKDDFYAVAYDDFEQIWYAAKDGRKFEAINCTELLGLIALWELYGDDCMHKDTAEDINEYRALIENSPMFDLDGEPCTLDEECDDDY